MVAFLSVLVMLIVAYSYFREGVFTAFCMMINVLVAGFVAFNFWEPLADSLEPMFSNSFLQGYEDCICLIFLMASVLGALRWATNQLVNTQIEHHTIVQQFGAGACGLMTGYLVAGFLVCTLQTLPWHDNFMGFEVKVDPEARNSKLRQLLPPDRVWLAIMHRAGEWPLGQSETRTFDPNGNFETRYSRYRRYTDVREPLNSAGELPP